MASSPASISELGDPRPDETPQDFPLAEAALSAAAEVAAQIEQGPVDRVTLSNGATLMLRPVPPLTIREAAMRVPKPAVPAVWVEDHQRLEPNPNDPDYLNALVEYQRTQLLAVSDVLMLLGTRLESLPDDMEPPESDDWIEALEALGITIDRTNKHKRYLNWLRLYALPSQSDLTHIIEAVTSLSGVTEIEVQRAAAAFRSNT